ncbi:hypothetical protein HDZ31DRAFT_27431, partial [Schizophyllum fasciatum]
MVHPALQITELVTLICSFASPETCACLARTCKDFLEPALDSLWSVQATFGLLLCILPDVFTLVPVANEDAFWVNLNRDLTDDEWARLAFYGARIKRLYVGHAFDGTEYALRLSAGFIHGWLRYTGRMDLPLSLCPRVAHVHWVKLSAFALPLECMFWSRPGVPSIELVMARMDPAQVGDDFASALQTVVNASLVQLRVTNPRADERPLDTIIARLVRQCTMLELVELSYVSPSCLQALGALPALHTLYIGGLAGLDDEVWSTAFTALKDLKVTGRIEESLYLLRKLSGAQGLRSVSIIFSYPSFRNNIPVSRRRPQQIACLCEAITRYCPAALTHLNITDDTSMWSLHNSEQSPYYAIEFDCISALRSLKSLRELVIEPWGSIDLDDRDMESLLSAWPVIESLHFLRPYSPRFEPVFTTLATPAALLSVARHCPRLREMTFTFDASGFRVVHGGRPGGGLTQSSLVMLDAGTYVWDHDDLTVALAALISDVFPALTNITSDAQREANALNEGEDIPEEYRKLEKLREMVTLANSNWVQER